MTELFAVCVRANDEPDAWAIAREREGWDGVAVPDHIFSSGIGLQHPFFLLGQMAAATNSVTLTTGVANNLLRSPVEFAQLSLTAQQLSHGRFEAGFGAGWAKDEIVGMGLDYPDPPQRARRFKEAVEIVRQCLTHGSCQYQGEHYTIDVPLVGPRPEKPPPLVAALGGPWTLANIGPLVDRIEVVPGHALNRGYQDLQAMAGVTTSQFRELLDAARAANPTAPVSTAFFIAAGQGPAIDAMAEAFGSKSIYSGLAGTPEEVANRIRELGDELQIDRLTVVPATPGSIEAVSPALMADRS